jgi:hypothetical protein
VTHSVPVAVAITAIHSFQLFTEDLSKQRVINQRCRDVSSSKSREQRLPFAPVKIRYLGRLRKLTVVLTVLLILSFLSHWN